MNEKQFFLKSKKYIYFIISLAVIIYLCSCSLGSIQFETVNNSLVEEENIKSLGLEIHFIDVGQADCILIQTDVHSMLIDAGNNNDGNFIAEYIKLQGVDNLEYVIGTHPHEDHIGGLAKIINSFEIDKIIMPKASTTTKTFENLLSTIIEKGMKVTTPVAGTKYPLGDAEFTILAPNSESYKDLNNYSVVIKLQYGSTSFLFTGDANKLSESEMINKGFNLEADMLKVGHHGSKTATSDQFLNEVNPKYAIISVGKDNKYGLPNNEVIQKINDLGCQIYRTDEIGTLIVKSDGKNINIKEITNEILKDTYINEVQSSNDEQPYTITYIGNKNTKKFHLSSCRSTVSEDNKIYFSMRDDYINAGYIPCKICNP